MLGTIYRQSSLAKKRPYSAMTNISHSSDFRLTDNQTLNSIKSSIHETFQNQNRSLKEIRGLTERVGSKYSKRIDRLCAQFNIGLSPRKKHVSGEVDVQFIAKRFINNKSKEKKKHLQRQKMKVQVAKIANRYHPKHPPSFFKFELETLREMESKSKLSSSRLHPYIEIYQQSQTEALTSLADQGELQLDKIGIYADIIEPQDWERYQKKVKQIYSGVRSLRRGQCKNSPYFVRSSTKENVFIT